MSEATWLYSNRDTRRSLEEADMNLAHAKVAQILIPVEDFDRGVAFYRDVLCIPFLFAAPPQMAFFDCAGVRLLVGVTPAGQKAQRGSAIYFQVSDIDAVYSFLADKAVHFRVKPHIVIGQQMRSFGWPSSPTRTEINLRC